MHVLLRVETGLHSTGSFSFSLTTTHEWFWLGIFDGAHGGSNKTPWPSTGKNTWLIRTTLFSHRIYRILLDSLDNANTCRDAVSVVKQVSTFAVWNHKRHYMRSTNQQGSSKKVSAVKDVQQKNIQIISPWADGSRRCKHGSRIMSTWYLRQQKERN